MDYPEVDDETFEHFLQKLHQRQHNLHSTDQSATTDCDLTPQLAAVNIHNKWTPLQGADDLLKHPVIM